MKSRVKNIAVFLLLGIISLTNTGIPYFVHSCLESQHTDFHLYSEISSSCDLESTCHKADVSVDDCESKGCCTNEEGFVKLDIEAHPQESFHWNDIALVSILLKKTSLAFITQDLYFAHYANPPSLLNGRQVRIVYESFLC